MASSRPLARIALRTSLLYWVVAAAYILLSDRAVDALVRDPDLAGQVQTAKGWSFVTLTALLLYFGLRSQLGRWEREANQRRAIAEALRTRVAQIRAILAHQPIAFFAGDEHGMVTIWEGRTWPEVQFPPGDIVGREMTALAGHDAEMSAALARAVAGETNAVEHRAQGRTFEVFHSPLHDADGRFMGVSGVVVDITERKKLEAQLMRAQRLESVGRLAGGVAHDLNNILSPVLIGASLLRTTVRDPDALGLLETIEASARRGASIIRQLLTFSRGATGEIAPIALQPIVNDMRHVVRETFPKNITMRVQAATEPLVIEGNATQIHQVLMNLCVNARDAMPEGGRLTMQLEAVEVGSERARENPGVQPGPFVVLRVQDTGTGISPEHVEQVFDPFFTTKEIGKGTGLGLSSALGIVKGHHGFIELETAPGVGTTFSIFLPRVTVAEPVASAPASGAGARAAPVQGQGECVLVVDDESSVRRMIRRALESCDYRVLEAADGAEGVQRFRDHRTDVRLIITDVMMPTMDAVGFVRAVREVDAKLPIISISGVDRLVKVEDLKALGVSEFLQKPFALEVLLDVVRKQFSPPGEKKKGAEKSPPPSS